MKTIVLASGNKGKLKEIREMLPDYEVVSCAELGFTEDIEETGKTFFENAMIKAKTVAEKLNRPTLADDSGLCVEALNGAPGIFSARYSKDGTDEGNCALLLKNLKNETNRKAKFVCQMILYYPNGEYISAVGETYGVITEEKFGNNGFGYDPIFLSTDLNKPFGLCSAEEKNSVSHRFRALTELKSKL
ncbi:MAG: RdgB/HAM1 family non-canonical purine NTP pyrophosphatase [Clostridia bacterium]|nr:RdgB/HAM1 family non-canonical purine NTP pyrophosphatase [Clostridia bacterium]